MRTPEQYAAEVARRREQLLQAAFKLFAARNIDSVTVEEIATEAGLTSRTLLRHFNGKADLVIETATYAWENVLGAVYQGRQDLSHTTAASDYEFFLDRFLDLYRNHADLLRFNQMFNIYIRAASITPASLGNYQKMMDVLRSRFSAIYAKQDGTLRKEYSEEEIFSTTLHLMLAVVTRYAVGLVYQGGTDTEQELLTQKEMLMERYTIRE